MKRKRQRNRKRRGDEYSINLTFVHKPTILTRWWGSTKTFPAISLNELRPYLSSWFDKNAATCNLCVRLGARAGSSFLFSKNRKKFRKNSRLTMIFSLYRNIVHGTDHIAHTTQAHKHQYAFSWCFFGCYSCELDQTGLCSSWANVSTEKFDHLEHKMKMREWECVKETENNIIIRNPLGRSF